MAYNTLSFEESHPQLTAYIYMINTLLIVIGLVFLL
jgi:hypothetical protein